MQNMKYSKDYTAGWQCRKLGRSAGGKNPPVRDRSSGFSSDEDDDEDENPLRKQKPARRKCWQYAWETVCYVIWAKPAPRVVRKWWKQLRGTAEGTLPTDFYSDNGEPGRKWWPAMSLPKRDGVQGRYYLIQKPDTNPEVLEHADQCIQDVLMNCKRNHSGYPVVVRTSGTPFLPASS
ncbi:MAG: hypothetical protein ACLTGY_09845 [Blautia faecis]